MAGNMKSNGNRDPRDDAVRFDALRTWEEVAAESTRRGMPITAMGAFKIHERAIAKIRQAMEQDQDFLDIALRRAA
jgi:hypothetical protein